MTNRETFKIDTRSFAYRNQSNPLALEANKLEKFYYESIPHKYHGNAVEITY